MAKAAKGLVPITVERLSRGGEDAYALAADEVRKRGLKVGKGPVRLSDGDGLYLLVEPSGSARWIFLFRWRGKLKEMGLGGLSRVSLKAAREKAQAARSLLGHDLNPIEAKHAKAAIPTFGEVADEMLDALAKGFKNPKHKVSWERAIGAPRAVKQAKGGVWTEADKRPSFAEPLRSKPVDQVTTNDVLAILKPLWSTRHETASRLRGQIAQVLDAAKAAGYRTGENPAAWDGNLKHRLPPRRKLTKGHRAALPYSEIPAFMKALRARPADSAKALEFTVLTAARAGEVLGMTWGEVDLDGKLWTIPAERMKRGLEHRVPLPDAAVDVLRAAALASAMSPGALVFQKSGKAFSENAMMTLIKRMEYAGVTVHGFRSSFRDWGGDATSYPRDLLEQALAHAVGNEVELAYRRSDALERRRKLMETWARFCGGHARVEAVASEATASELPMLAAEGGRQQ